ncbi:MAG: DEAD/DEAH box helicase [Deltaproteobacteria bacterium]|nr:DEAD/DEAH box helicase [Deltaproteobacteria bacterium]
MNVGLALALQEVRRAARYVLVGPGQWIRLGEELVAALKPMADAMTLSDERIRLRSTFATALADLENAGASLATGKDFRIRVELLQSLPNLDPHPSSAVRTALRPYQEEGYSWMTRMAHMGMGVCLADDMGIGKTLQVLAVLADRASAGPALVIAPTSLSFNWEQEARSHVPGRLVPRHYSGGRLDGIGRGDLVITSYGKASKHVAHLERVRFATLVLDEAQAIKNASTERTKAMCRIPADWRVAMSGTPIENDPAELWSIFSVVQPGLLGTFEEFRTRYFSAGSGGAGALGEAMRPYVLRRRKADVLPDLPSRTVIDIGVELSEGELSLYEDFRAKAIAATTDRLTREPLKVARGRILVEILRLRQLACHPRLFDDTFDLPSAKLAAFAILIRKLSEGGHKFLVFSQFARFLRLAAEEVRKAGLRGLYLDGATSRDERRQLVETFQAGKADCFLISTRAGGFGLNLTEADYVVHLDHWWNPAVEDQASDRAHRIGQTRPVTIARLVSRGTIEEAILKLHDAKRTLTEDFLAGAARPAKFTIEDLIALIRGPNAEYYCGGKIA